jgi:hypothetical protein
MLCIFENEFPKVEMNLAAASAIAARRWEQGFVLSLPDSGFCNFDGRRRNSYSQNGTAHHGTKSLPVATNLRTRALYLLIPAAAGCKKWAESSIDRPVFRLDSIDLRAQRAPEGEQVPAQRPLSGIRGIKKDIDKTNTWRSGLITTACYLCNTYPKTILRAACEAFLCCVCRSHR